MFFVMPLTSIIFIYIFAAIFPAIFLMRYIYNQDNIEKEPVDLLIRLIFAGVLAALVSIVLEEIGERILPGFISSDNPHYQIFFAFIVVACVEEGTKFFFLYRRTWNNPSFNYRFDAIVYAAFVSLGFAAFENIGYVFNFGITVAPMRAILAIPGHLGFSVFMGYFYGRARFAADMNRKGLTGFLMFMAYASAVFLHGFYDSCAMIQTSTSTIVFIAFVVIMYIVVFHLIKHESRTDRLV